ncbi:MAG: transposase [Anaerovoracaceae bacterium]
MKTYPTNLTDNQWQVIEKIINAQERKRKHSLRGIMDAMLYIIKTSCQWRGYSHRTSPPGRPCISISARGRHIVVKISHL